MIEFSEDVLMPDIERIVAAEFAENTERKDFTWSEAVEIKRAIEPVEKAAAKERQVEGGRSGGKAGGKLPQASTGKSRDKIGAFAGVSGRTVDKIAAVVAAAHREPENY